MDSEHILILDCGGQYTHLIKQQLRYLGVESVILPADVKLTSYRHIDSLKAVIISGGKGDATKPSFEFDESWISLGMPILGICYGHQLIAKLKGGTLTKAQPEYGDQKLTLHRVADMLGLKDKNINVWMSHSQTVSAKPVSATVIGSTENDANSYLVYPGKIYTTQFHPEVSHSKDAHVILQNFALKIARVSKVSPWMATQWVNAYSSVHKTSLEKRKIVIGLSGGVDSMTLAALLRRNHDKRSFLAIYVDTGFMPSETVKEVQYFCKKLDINLKVVSAEPAFISAVKGITDPRKKGKVIGERFIREFERVAREFGATHLAQGTIWSDVVESGVTKFSSKIKPHHNVGGLPKRMELELVEPFRELFKDQVRAIAKELKLPKEVIEKKVFPGPGFAIRIDGEVTRSKLNTIRRATEIVDQAIEGTPASSSIWMAFPILVNAESLGIEGDKRVWNKEIIVIRAVESQNSMTVKFSESIYPHLSEISTKICNELPIGRVVYDITNKPPGTIEWQ